MTEMLDNSTVTVEGTRRGSVPLRAAWVVSDDTPAPHGAIVDELSARGIEPVCICRPTGPGTGLDQCSVDVIPTAIRRWFRPGKALASLADKLRKKGVQILHALDCQAGQTSALLAAELGCPHVVNSNRLGDGRLIGRMSVKPAMVLAAGMAVKLDLVESLCIRPEQVAIVPPAVSHIDNADCLTIPGQCRSILTSDVFDDYGATAAVIDAFARLDRSQNDCLLFAVGNGPAEHMLRKHAEELDLCSRLTFVDRLDSRQLAGVFQAADIYISPRGASGINFDALLAMASGAAVMAPEDHVSDFLIDGQTASMFRSRDARDIAEHLTEMLNDRQKTASLARGALEYLDMNHAPDRIAMKIARACRSAMSPRPSRVPLSA